jgi:hypothetical protein
VVEESFFKIEVTVAVKLPARKAPPNLMNKHTYLHSKVVAEIKAEERAHHLSSISRGGGQKQRYRVGFTN